MALRFRRSIHDGTRHELTLMRSRDKAATAISSPSRFWPDHVSPGAETGAFATCDHLMNATLADFGEPS